MNFQTRLDALHQKLFNRKVERDRANRSISRIESQIKELERIIENPELAEKSHVVSRNLKKKPAKKKQAEKVFSEETNEMPLEKETIKPRNLKALFGEALFGEGGSDD